MVQALLLDLNSIKKYTSLGLSLSYDDLRTDDSRKLVKNKAVILWISGNYGFDVDKRDRFMPTSGSMLVLEPYLFMQTRILVKYVFK